MFSLWEGGGSSFNLKDVLGFSFLLSDFVFVSLGPRELYLQGERLRERERETERERERSIYIYIYMCCEVTNWATFGHFNSY